jgi:hypothetical protein
LGYNSFLELLVPEYQAKAAEHWLVRTTVLPNVAHQKV